MEISHETKIAQHYYLECYGADGKLKWKEDFENLVVTAGRNHYLDATLKTGSVSPLWYVGLKNVTAETAADTMASKPWTEITAYSQATRPQWVPGTVASGSVDNVASKAVFTINAPTTIYGAFLVNNNTKGGTTGILLGAGNFTPERPVIIGDILNVTVVCSATSV
jgi:hypothetical protein